MAWYCSVSGDILMKEPHDKVWFSSMVLGEVLMQLPFFFVAVHMIYKHGKDSSNSDSKSYPKWFHKACLVYGSHVATTLIPINGTLLMSTEMTTIQKIVTLAIYSPYWIFPLLLVWYAWEDEKDSHSRDSSHSKVANRAKEE